MWRRNNVPQPPATPALPVSDGSEAWEALPTEQQQLLADAVRLIALERRKASGDGDPRDGDPRGGDPRDGDPGDGDPGDGPGAQSLEECVEQTSRTEEPPADELGLLLLKALRSGFGLESFRHGQLAAIRRVLAAEPLLLILPTGTGKSLVYQLPTLLSTQVTLVVSPLLALMSDQLAALPKALHGLVVSSELSWAQRREAIAALHRRDACGAASTRVLFVAPERLSDKSFQLKLQALPPVSGCRCGVASAAAAEAARTAGLGAAAACCASCGARALPPIGLACIDEAHCLSEWSHNFRPAYMAVGANLRRLGVSRLLALTATATARTAASICAGLGLPHTAVLRSHVARPNLRLGARLVPSAGAERLDRLLQLLREKSPLRGGAIVYCLTKLDAERAATLLLSHGWKADFYHAGREPHDRRRVHFGFLKGELEVVTATVAFGMGVDKRDVRLVVHLGLPRSPEHWVQESGRAGRDGLPADCVALVCEEDYRWLHSRCHSDGVEFEQLHKVLVRLLRNCRNGFGELALSTLEKSFDMGREVVQTALALLGEIPESQWREPEPSPGEGELRRGRAQGEAGGDGVAGEGGEAGGSGEAAGFDGGARAAQELPAGATAAAPQEGRLMELLPEIRRTALLSFHKEGQPPEAVAEQSPLVAMLLKTAKKSNGTYKCSLVHAAAELGIDAHSAHHELLQLHEAGRLQLELQDTAIYMRVRRAVTPGEVSRMARLLASHMAAVEHLDLMKLNAVAAMLWALARAAPAETAAGAGGISAAEIASAPIERTLRRYFADDELVWVAPVAAVRVVGGEGRLRGDLHTFIASQLEAASKPGKAKHELSGRAVARIFHGISSPAFPYKAWSGSSYWRMHKDVNFEVLRRLAAEVLETARRLSAQKKREKELSAKRGRGAGGGG